MFIHEVKFGVASSNIAVFPVLSLRVRDGNNSVVGCKNQHHCPYSVPVTEEQMRQWMRFIFYDSVPWFVLACVCANHFTSDYRIFTTIGCTGL